LPKASIEVLPEASIKVLPEASVERLPEAGIKWTRTNERIRATGAEAERAADAVIGVCRGGREAVDCEARARSADVSGTLDVKNP
jgi:hypothetical protein